jgi:3-deoxy-D-arabino-heptulosonate 7-phosphate (DAHP) synthase class II
MAKNPEELVSLIRKLNPSNEPGKITLITRLGKAKVRPAKHHKIPG